MKLHELKFNEGARTVRKRVGRGAGSGNGGTAGKGHKGQNARSGGGVAIGFEGGQTPLYKRIPKRGFTNFTRKVYGIVNVESLNRFDDETVVTVDMLLNSKLVTKKLDGIKVLGSGTIEKKLTVCANKFSKTAVEAIEKAGGKVEVI